MLCISFSTTQDDCAMEESVQPLLMGKYQANLDTGSPLPITQSSTANTAAGPLMCKTLQEIYQLETEGLQRLRDIKNRIMLYSDEEAWSDYTKSNFIAVDPANLGDCIIAASLDSAFL